MLATNPDNVEEIHDEKLKKISTETEATEQKA